MKSNQIESQTTITQPGTYTLARDIPSGGGTRLSEACIRIEADDVVLDGKGHTVSGNGVSDTTGIVVSNVQNVTVKNVTLSEWDYGFRSENARKSEVRNVRTRDNGYGMVFDETNLMVLRTCRITRNLLGMVSDTASRVIMWNNTIEQNSGRDIYRY